MMRQAIYWVLEGIAFWLLRASWRLSPLVGPNKETLTIAYITPGDDVDE